MATKCKLSVPCTVHHITWHPKGYQCLNCGAVAEHSWDIKHAAQPKPVQIRIVREENA